MVAHLHTNTSEALKFTLRSLEEFSEKEGCCFLKCRIQLFTVFDLQHHHGTCRMIHLLYPYNHRNISKSINGSRTSDPPFSSLRIFETVQIKVLSLCYCSYKLITTKILTGPFSSKTTEITKIIRIIPNKSKIVTHIILFF